MKKFLSKCLLALACVWFLANCARDLSSNVYTSDATQSFTLQGQIVSVRRVRVKETDRLGDNEGGMLAGGAMGAALGSGAGNGSGMAPAIVGGALLGGAAGALVQSKLGEAEGLEYVIKINTKIKGDQYYDGSAAMRSAISSALASGLMTVVQGADTVLNVGQKVFVIVSNKRTRITPAL